MAATSTMFRTALRKAHFLGAPAHLSLSSGKVEKWKEISPEQELNSEVGNADCLDQSQLRVVYWLSVDVLHLKPAILVLDLVNT